MKRTELIQLILPALAAMALLMFGMPLAARPSTDGKFTVVIDAGHGGKDHGAIGKLSREKNINLGVALKLGKLIEDSMDDVNVVYTRSSDNFVSLQGRADIANRAGGDLFISIHTNSAPEKSKTRMSASGTSVYVLGRKSEENLAVAKRENAVMMLEDNYTSTYKGFDPNSTESYIAFELLQNQHMEHSLQAAQAIQTELVNTAGRRDNGVRQAMFWVLVQTGMPAVLVELDFICNPQHDRYLGSEAGQTQLAEAIYNGFCVYKAAYDKEMRALGHTSSAKSGKAAKKVKPESDSKNKSERKANSKKVESKKETDKENKSESDVVIYKIQFMTSNRQLGERSATYKGIDQVESYKDGNVWKYTTGRYQSIDEANKKLKEVKNLFPDAFVIKTRNGKRIK